MDTRLRSRLEGLALIPLGFIVLVLFLAGPRESRTRVQEAVLRTDLRTIRDAIDNYTLDRKHPPQSLRDLVDAGYIRTIPVDPITHNADWRLDFEGPILGDPILSPDLKAQGLSDVHSNSSRISSDGTKYNEW